MQLTINGQVKDFRELNAGSSVSELIASLGIKPDRVAIEQNGEIVSRKAWGNALVNAGDRFEIVHFVGGGLA